MLAKLSCTFDTRNLMAAHEIMQVHSRWTPAEGLNRTALFVVRKAQEITAEKSTSISRIDTELQVQVSPVIGKRGKPLSMKSAKNRIYNANGVGSGKDPHPDVPLTWLITSARAKPGSNYNNITSNRWMIVGGHPLKGHKVSEFKGIFDAIISRMVKGRHSSTHFLEHTWAAIINAILPHVPETYRGRTARQPKVDPELGSVTPAVGGGATCFCIIENRLGMSGLYPALDESRNQAAHRILAPALQRAIDIEADAKLEEAWRRGWLGIAPKLKILGVEVSA